MLGASDLLDRYLFTAAFSTGWTGCLISAMQAGLAC
jgi:hypothetical protein